MGTYDTVAFVPAMRMNVSRRRQALHRILAEVEADASVADLADPVRHALQVHEAALRAERAYKGVDDATMHQSVAVDLDQEIDGTVIAFVRALKALAALHDEDGPRGQAIRALLAPVPKNLRDLVNLPFVQQHAAIDVLLDEYRDDTGAWRAEVVMLDLDGVMDGLADLNARYGEALTRQTRSITYDDVKQMDLDAYVLYVGVIARILGRFPDPTAEHDEGRRRLLAPIVDQQEEATLWRRRRKAARRGETFDEESLEPLGDADDDDEEAA